MFRRLTWSAGLLCSVLLVCVLSRQPQRHSGSPHFGPLLPRIEVVRVLGAPLLHLWVDYLWIRTSHAVGAAATPEEYRDVYAYADLLTELDPKFQAVYAFAGASLPQNLGRGKWANTEESTRILEKGVRVLPEKPFLRILLAYNLANFEKDYLRAAKMLEEASRLPDAPSYLAPLATRLYARGGKIDVGLELATSLAESASDPETRATFQLRVLQLRLEQLLEEVDQVVDAFSAREGRLPSGLEELVASKDLLAMPVDPLGGRIYLDPDGRARSSSEKKRLTELATDLQP